jgi:glutamate N-acetyltransferase/amino-acid N-acetyltransferase
MGGGVQITVDGDTSTNDCVVAMASGFAGNDSIRNPDSVDARRLQAALTALLQGLAKTIAWDGEGATVCIEVCAPRP